MLIVRSKQGYKECGTVFEGNEDMKEEHALQQVANVVHHAGLAKLVARLKPVIVVKG